MVYFNSRLSGERPEILVAESQCQYVMYSEALFSQECNFVIIFIGKEHKLF